MLITLPPKPAGLPLIGPQFRLRINLLTRWVWGTAEFLTLALLESFHSLSCPTLHSWWLRHASWKHRLCGSWVQSERSMGQREARTGTDSPGCGAPSLEMLWADCIPLRRTKFRCEWLLHIAPIVGLWIPPSSDPFSSYAALSVTHCLRMRCPKIRVIRQFPPPRNIQSVLTWTWYRLSFTWPLATWAACHKAVNI